MISIRSRETFPARASSTSLSSPSSSANFEIVSSEGGGTTPRSTLLRYAGSTPMRCATFRRLYPVSRAARASRRSRIWLPNGVMLTVYYIVYSLSTAGRFEVSTAAQKGASGAAGWGATSGGDGRSTKAPSRGPSCFRAFACEARAGQSRLHQRWPNAEFPSSPSSSPTKTRTTSVVDIFAVGVVNDPRRLPNAGRLGFGELAGKAHIGAFAEGD